MSILKTSSTKQLICAFEPLASKYSPENLSVRFDLAMSGASYECLDETAWSKLSAMRKRQREAMDPVWVDEGENEVEEEGDNENDDEDENENENEEEDEPGNEVSDDWEGDGEGEGEEWE
jgi:hypothetical protein